QIGGQVADRCLERRLRHAHDAIGLEHTLASEVSKREDASAALLLHQRKGASRERDERVSADVHRQLEAVARRLDEWLQQAFARGVRRAVNNEIESAKRAFDLFENAIDLRVVGYVHRKDKRIAQRRAELADVFPEPLTLVRERQPRTSVRR